MEKHILKKKINDDQNKKNNNTLWLKNKVKNNKTIIKDQTENINEKN
jgi:hypothetical protein